MASFQSCTGPIASSIGLDCRHPLEGGYTGRVILIPWRVLSEASPSISRDNPAYITMPSVSPTADFPIFAIDNAEYTSPFDGSSSTGTDEDGIRKYLKQLAFRIPLRGGLASKNILDPLLHDNGSSSGYIAVVEKRGIADRGTFEVIGFYSPLRVVDPSSVSRNENENGGSWGITLQCKEYYADCELAQAAGTPSYHGNLDWFESAWGQAVAVDA